MGQRYLVGNFAMPTTAVPVKQPTGTAIRTMLQLATSAGNPIWVEKFHISFDGTAAATPIQVELVETGSIAATMSTAHVAAGVVQQDLAADGGVSTLSLGATNLTGFATAAVTEGTITATRMAWADQIPPSSTFTKQWSLGTEFMVPPSRYLRVRVTAGASVNCLTTITFHD